MEWLVDVFVELVGRDARGCVYLGSRWARHMWRDALLLRIVQACPVAVRIVSR